MNKLFSEESGFAKRQIAAHWGGKQSPLKQVTMTSIFMKNSTGIESLLPKFFNI